MSWIEWTENSFRGLDLTKLKVDQAYLNITNLNDQHFFLYTLSDECVACPFRKIKRVPNHNETIVKLDTARPIELRLFTKDKGAFINPDEVKSDLFWNYPKHFGQFGVYDLIIKESGVPEIKVAKEPVSTLSCKSINFFSHDSSIINKSLNSSSLYRCVHCCMHLLDFQVCQHILY